MSVIVVVIAVGALVAVALELFFRWLTPALPSPLRWHTRLLEFKADLLTETGRRGPVPIVVAGSSMPFVGIDTDAICDAAHLDRDLAHNASFFRAMPDVGERWVLEEVVPRVRPSVVVYAISPIELNDNGELQHSITQAYSRAPKTRRDWRARLMLAVEDRSALVRHRRKLARRPDLLLAGIRRRVGRGSELSSELVHMDGILGPRGNGIETRDWEYRLSDRRKDWVRTQVLNDYEIGGHQAAALTRLVTRLREQDIEPVLAVMPVADDFLALYPNGRADHERGLQLIEEIAASTGTRLVDVGADMTAERWFGDAFHFNGAGAAEYSARLGRELWCELRGAAGLPPVSLAS